MEQVEHTEQMKLLFSLIDSVPSVPLVPLIPRNGTEQGGVFGRYYCSTCSACSAQGVERNKHARSKRSSEGSEGIEGNEGMQADGDVISGRCCLDLCRWCPVPPAVLMPGPIWKAVLALLGRTSRPERQPSLPPFAGRLCRNKSVTDSRTPSAPLAYAQGSRTLKEKRSRPAVGCSARCACSTTASSPCWSVPLRLPEGRE